MEATSPIVVLSILVVAWSGLGCGSNAHRDVQGFGLSPDEQFKQKRGSAYKCLKKYGRVSVARGASGQLVISDKSDVCSTLTIKRFRSVEVAREQLQRSKRAGQSARRLGYSVLSTFVTSRGGEHRW